MLRKDTVVASMSRILAAKEAEEGEQTCYIAYLCSPTNVVVGVCVLVCLVGVCVLV